MQCRQWKFNAEPCGYGAKQEHCLNTATVRVLFRSPEDPDGPEVLSIWEFCPECVLEIKPDVFFELGGRSWVLIRKTS